jgi:hypothetical protein
MPRFVLLYHECPPSYERPSHWDFMLESGDALRTWALPQLPQAWHKAHATTTTLQEVCPPLLHENVVPADQLADHRLAYLDQEGPLSGERGHVQRIDAGTFTTQLESADRFDFTLVGNVLQGRVSLHRASPNDAQWQLTWLA